MSRVTAYVCVTRLHVLLLISLAWARTVPVTYILTSPRMEQNTIMSRSNMFQLCILLVLSSTASMYVLTSVDTSISKSFHQL